MTAVEPRPRANSFTLDHRADPTNRRAVQYRTICTCPSPHGITPWRETANQARLDGTAHHQNHHRGEPR